MAGFSMGAEPFSGVSFPGDCSATHDVNFSLPLPPTLETIRVQLTPFIPSVHGEVFYSSYSSTPELGQYFPVALTPYPTFLSFVEDFMRSDPGNVLFAIIDKTKGTGELKSRLAGIIGMVKCSPDNRAIEVGPVIVLPAFQRTFVSSNAIGAILKYLLDVPSEGGVGFRRVVWTAHPENRASVRAAERMGFKLEGILRWSWCLPGGIPFGREVGKERGSASGRDSAMLAICWDDWENGGKEHVEKLIHRQ